MTPTAYSISKIWATVAVILGPLYLASLMAGDGLLAYLPVVFAFFGLVAIHSVTTIRDYAKQPMTQAEVDYSVANEKREMLATLIHHLESNPHRSGDCGSECPVADLVTKIGLNLK